VLFVERDGDKAAVPALARKVLKQLSANDVLVVDGQAPFEAKGLGTLVKDNCHNWHR
jgi:hypothetical protein